MTIFAVSAEDAELLDRVVGICTAIVEEWKGSDVLPAAALLAAIVSSRILHELPTDERRELLVATVLELDAMVECGSIRVRVVRGPRGNA